jgi:hypothetical protein
MVPRQHATVDSRLLATSDLRRLHGHVERRRPIPKNKRPPGYYESLIKRHDTTQTAIKHKYADATKDNLRNIRAKFKRCVSDALYQGIDVVNCPNS